MTSLLVWSKNSTLADVTSAASVRSLAFLILNVGPSERDNDFAVVRGWIHLATYKYEQTLASVDLIPGSS